MRPAASAGLLRNASLLIATVGEIGVEFELHCDLVRVKRAESDDAMMMTAAWG